MKLETKSVTTLEMKTEEFELLKVILQGVLNNGEYLDLGPERTELAHRIVNITKGF